MAPVTGDILHVWSEAEPYVTFSSAVSDVRAAADGEVMSIAHGPEEERIIRLRHTDGHETLYGNLADCFVDVGDTVEAGEIIATLIHQQPLAFELRVDGRSVDPSGRMDPIDE
jgi:murein DD-endopeptidase MepM/ murein hydrolase activator NlpD